MSALTLVLILSLTALGCLINGSPFEGKRLIKWDQQQGLFQGDIEMPKNRNGLLATSPKIWTNGVVYYEYSDFKNWTQAHYDMMQEAMKMIEKHTCIKFVKRTNEPNYFNMVNGASCSSEGIGMLGGKQRLSLMDDPTPQSATCWGVGTVMHEFLHAVGLWHEQMRYDRDDYIDVHEENFANMAEFQFRKVSNNVSSTYDIKYNYKSIMHYSAWAFSGNTKPTMTPKEAGVALEDLGRGQMWDYESDWEKLRRMYRCQGTYSPEPCVDTSGDSYCEYYKNKCGNEDWMKDVCAKKCGLCPEDQCKDELSYCSTYADQCGKQAWTATSCRKTCKVC